MRNLNTALTLAGIVLALTFATSAQARPSYPGIWEGVYPASETKNNVENGTGSECQLCHAGVNGGNPWNAYGWAIRTEWEAGATIEQAINIVAGDDSDLDPTAASNDDEIFGDTQPGWTEGPNNTIFFRNGTTDTNQEPPTAILGFLDPAPPVQVSCDVMTSQPTYTNGQTLVLQVLRFANAAAVNEPVRMRLTLILPNGVGLDMIDVGNGGGFALPAGLNRNFGPLNLFTISPSFPRGSFAFRCGLEDPITGDVLAEDTEPFSIQ